MSENGKQYLIALDAGGTMTDTFLVDKEGHFTLGKALTNREDESESYMASTADAAFRMGTTRPEIHKDAVSCVYTGTTMLNILLTETGQKVGLLTTKGFELSAHMERALTWLGKSYEDTMKLALHEHTPWLVDVRLVKGVAERIKGPTYYVGCHLEPKAVVVPMVERDVIKGTEELLDAGVEVIGILFLHSYVNPEHELKAAEIARDLVKRRGLDVPVLTSYEVCPVAMETQRVKSLLLQCYAALPAARQLFKVEEKAKGEGYKYDLSTLLSYGATVNIRYPRIYEAVTSGPTGGLLGAKSLLGEKKGIQDIICCDLGGTTFDAGIIAKDVVPINPEPALYGHKLNLPMVNVDSIGAGTGSVIHVDEYLKRITLGPDSAGALVGRCYKYPEITIGDIDVVLGYLSPDNFLGGQIALNKKAALKALEERLAKPLGQEIYDVSSKVLDLMHASLREHIYAVLTSKGYNPAEYTLIVYGGSGPMHLWGIAEGLKLGAVCTVPWAAAFSAYGVACADYFHRYDKSIIAVFATLMPDMVKVMQAEPMNEAWQELEERAYRELESEGFPREKVSFRYGIYGRYLGQMASWPAWVDIGRVRTIEDLNKVISGFEKTYTSIYPIAARFPEAGYVITGVFLEARVERMKPVVLTFPLKDKKPSKGAYKGQRKVYHRKWMDFDLWEMDLLEAGNRVEGPAIIEHPMTTLVIPPGNYAEFDEHKVIWYH